MIICVSELAISFLITLSNKGKVHNIFHITFMHVLTISFIINGQT